jgi:hypothetical protein
MVTNLLRVKRKRGLLITANRARSFNQIRLSRSLVWRRHNAKLHHHCHYVFHGCCLTTGYVMNAALQGIELEAVQVDVEGDLDLNGFFGLSKEVSPGYSDVRAIVRLTAPKATTEQLETLHATVTRTSPVGSILERPVRVSTELQRG